MLNLSDEVIKLIDRNESPGADSHGSELINIMKGIENLPINGFKHLSSDLYSAKTAGDFFEAITKLHEKILGFRKGNATFDITVIGDLLLVYAEQGILSKHTSVNNYDHNAEKLMEEHITRTGGIKKNMEKIVKYNTVNKVAAKATNTSDAMHLIQKYEHMSVKYMQTRKLIFDSLKKQQGILMKAMKITMGI
jgi:hypothetical protein